MFLGHTVEEIRAMAPQNRDKFLESLPLSLQQTAYEEVFSEKNFREPAKRQVNPQVRSKIDHEREALEFGVYPTVTLSVDHPFASMRSRNGTVPVHRLVMANHLGRPLTSDEVVHHLTLEEGGKGPTCHAIENLRLFSSNSAHRRHHNFLQRQKKASNLRV